MPSQPLEGPLGSQEGSVHDRPWGTMRWAPAVGQEGAHTKGGGPSAPVTLHVMPPMSPPGLRQQLPGTQSTLCLVPASDHSLCWAVRSARAGAGPAWCVSVSTWHPAASSRQCLRNEAAALALTGHRHSGHADRPARAPPPPPLPRVALCTLQRCLTLPPGIGQCRLWGMAG